MNTSIGAIERDAVTELLNIAIGRAAASLSQLVEDEVRLSVPSVDFLSPGHAIARLKCETEECDSVAVRQHFDGRFSGDIMLIFPGHSSLTLVRSLLGEQVPIDSLTELEREAFLEIGNIILNACLGSLSNQLGLATQSTLPAFVRGPAGTLLDLGSGGDEEVVMFLHVDFSLVRQNVAGFLAFVMDIVSARHFVQAVGDYIARIQAD